MMKYLLGTVFAALLLAPLAFTSQAQQGPTKGDTLAHCGSCGKDKCKEGCDCKKCKKKAKKGDDDKGEALLADCGSCEKGKCKEGCDCKKCKKKAKKGDDDKGEALLAQCKGCGKKKKKSAEEEEALLFAA